MPSELDEEDFDELTDLIRDSLSTEFSMELELMDVNPYIAIKAPRRLPGTRQEMISSLRSNFTEEQYHKFPLSFIDADKEKGDYVYRVLIKEQTDEDVFEPDDE